MTKDYYKILDITEFSTEDEIKSAYRHLARKWHPDVAGNSPDVIARFKEINEAYEILSDKIKKADYDTARRFYSYAKGSAASSAKANYKTTEEPKKSHTNFNFSWENLFSKTAPKHKPKAPKRGEDIYSDVEISVFEAISGTTKVINMLQTDVCPKCNGRKFVNGSQCAYCRGKGETSTYKRFSVKIPAGIKNKSKIRLAGEGEKGRNGGNSGDLYLTIHIREQKNYKTDGLNILKTIAISPYEAVLGADITVQTLNGNVSLKINPKTKNGQKIRLAGCGIEQNKKIGDMIVTVEIQIPSDLTEEEIRLYKKLQEVSRANIRERLE